MKWGNGRMGARASEQKGLKMGHGVREGAL